MYANKKNNISKVVVLMLCLALLVGGVIGGTIAYLMDTTEEVKNTFVAGNIGDLDLQETCDNSFIVTPGCDIEKDPTLTFTGFNVPAYVFVKIDATGWQVTSVEKNHTYSLGVAEDKKMTWVLEGWNALDGYPGVYYNEVEADAGIQTWALIKDNTITVSAKITAKDITSYGTNLIFSAYAIQQKKTADAVFGPEAAWLELNPTSGS